MPDHEPAPQVELEQTPRWPAEERCDSVFENVYGKVRRAKKLG